MNEIIIRRPPVKRRRNDIVRLQPDASDIILDFEEKEKLPASYLVSEIIRQAAPYIKFKEADKS